MKTAAFTICAFNFLANAMVLRDSFMAVEPGMDFFIFLADGAGEGRPELPEGVIPVSKLGLDDLLGRAFRYSLVEFNTSIKADCFLHLLQAMGFGAAIYLDPDIQVFAPLDDVRQALEQNMSAVLTPHLLDPALAGRNHMDFTILRSGVFNLGFGAFSATEESLEFLRWWSAKLRYDCLSAPQQGLFVDQRFVDMAPAFIQNLKIIRHPGYNVAYWNLHERRIELSHRQLGVNGRELVFFHFSGVVPGEPNKLSRHLGAEQPVMDPVITGLVRNYVDRIERWSQAGWCCVPYAFENFRNGMPILLPMRRDPPRRGSPSDWFAAPDAGYWNSPDPGFEDKSDVPITRLMGAYLRLRPDLAEAFPMITGDGRRAYVEWFHDHGVREYRVPDTFLPARAGRKRLLNVGRRVVRRVRALLSWGR